MTVRLNNQDFLNRIKTILAENIPRIIEKGYKELHIFQYEGKEFCVEKNVISYPEIYREVYKKIFSSNLENWLKKRKIFCKSNDSTFVIIFDKNCDNCREKDIITIEMSNTYDYFHNYSTFYKGKPFPGDHPWKDGEYCMFFELCASCGKMQGKFPIK